MPPKLRKEKSTPGTKSGSTTSNMFNVLSDDSPKQHPTQTTHDVSTMATAHPPTSPTRLDTIQNDIKSMASIIHAMSHSFNKMDKLDKIDQLESRQKSSEEKITGMITDLHSEFETLKTNNAPPTYADILKTTERQNKNISATTSTTPLLEVLAPTQVPTQIIPTSIPDQNTLLPTDPSKYQASDTNTVPTNQASLNTPSTNALPTQQTSTTNLQDTSNILSIMQHGSTGTNQNPPKQTPQMPPPTPSVFANQHKQRIQKTTNYTSHGHNPPTTHSTQAQRMSTAPPNQNNTHDTNSQMESTQTQSNTQYNSQNSSTYMDYPTQSHQSFVPNMTPTPSSKTHKYWKLAAAESHQPHRFLQYIDNLKLNGDTISDLRQFYEHRHIFLSATFSYLITNFIQDIIPFIILIIGSALLFMPT